MKKKDLPGGNESFPVSETVVERISLEFTPDAEVVPGLSGI